MLDIRTITRRTEGADRMNVARSAAAASAVARFYLRPVRRVVSGGGRATPGTWRVRLGPVRVGVQRITAPVCPGNEAAARTMRRAGTIREATMASFLDVGGRRRDHDLWAITVNARQASRQQS